MRHKVFPIIMMMWAVTVTASPALAKDARIAFSKKLDVEVIAKDSGGAWCKKDLKLRITVGRDSLLKTSELGKFIQMLKPVLDRDCVLAETAHVVSFKKDGALFAPPMIARKQDEWAATVAATPSAPTTSNQLASAQTPEIPKTIATASPPILEALSDNTDSNSTAFPEIPRERGYEAAMLKHLHDNPSKVEEEQVLHWWAAYRFRKEYQENRNHEFKLQPILQNAKSDLLETLAKTDTNLVTVMIETNFSDYDFKTERFPIAINSQSLQIGRSGYDWAKNKNLPHSFDLTVPDLELITGLPMDSKKAQSFAENRTQHRNINRRIAIALTIRINPPGLKSGANGKGNVEQAIIYADHEMKQPIHFISKTEIDTVRNARNTEKAAIAKAEEERQLEQRRQQETQQLEQRRQQETQQLEQRRQQEARQLEQRRQQEKQQAEWQRQQMLAQRDQSIESLSQASTSVKLANWIGDDNDQVNYSLKLSNLRTARGSALIHAKPTVVSLLIQAKENGREKVETQWPGMLQVTVPPNQPELKSSNWYLVRGVITVPESVSLPPAQLTAQAVYACVQPKCAEATDTTAIVDRKLASLKKAH